MAEKFSAEYLPSPWIVFSDSIDHNRWCQPDGLLIDVRKGKITVVEIKYAHGSRAWFQLFQLYIPLLRFMFPPFEWEVVGLEIVKWYDPQIAVPANVVLRERITDAIVDNFCVHILKV